LTEGLDAGKHETHLTRSRLFRANQPRNTAKLQRILEQGVL
jgi:hypothetical protein